MCNFLVQMLQYFFLLDFSFGHETIKKLPSKVGHNRPKLVFFHYILPTGPKPAQFCSIKNANRATYLCIMTLIATSAPDSSTLDEPLASFSNSWWSKFSFMTKFLRILKISRFFLVTRQSLCHCDFTRHVLKLKVNRKYTGNGKLL